AADEEDSLDEIAPELLAVRVCGAEQVAQHVLAREVEELAFEGVEDPTGGGNDEDEPLIASDAGVPGAGVGVRRGRGDEWLQARHGSSKCTGCPVVRDSAALRHIAVDHQPSSPVHGTGVPSRTARTTAAI